MPRYIISATLASEEAADKFVNILFRSGATLGPLTAKDPVTVGQNAALVMIRLDTAEEDLKIINRYLKSCLAHVEWSTCLVLPAEHVTSLVWSCRGSQAKTQPNGQDSPAGQEFGTDEDEWFAAGDKMVLEADP